MYLFDQDDMQDPPCPKCDEVSWKTWDGSAYCRGCGELISTNEFASLMGLDI